MELDLTKTRETVILVDIDSLYDTRLSTLLKIDSNVARNIIKKDLYNGRLIDEFDYITKKIFRFYYDLRGIETLKNSLLTKITDVIVAYLGHLKINLHEVNETKPITIVINTYPYKLGKSKEYIKSNISKLLNFSGITVDITYDNLMSYEPFVLETKFNAIIMYDGLHWLYEYYSKYEDLNHNAPRLKLICPALLDKPIVLKKKEDYVKLFEDIAESFKTFIDLDFINVDFFNAIEPKID